MTVSAFHIAALAAAACAVPGAFLVLRRMALMSDAISHVLLLGIVLAFLATGDLASPFLLFGAAAVGVVCVALVEALQRTKRVKEDSAIGLVFPALFSVGVILVSKFVRNVHLDADAVLAGELVLAVNNRLMLGGRDLGPKALWFVGTALIANLLFVTVFSKELKLATFDSALAATLGFAPAVLHYALMTLVSITAVAAFDAVGSVLVVGLMIAPAATAYLLTDDLRRMIALSVLIGILAAWLGCRLAERLDANYAGAISTALGGLFTLALFAAPQRGLCAQVRRRSRQRRTFEETMLVVHLANHEDTPAAAVECRLAALPEHLRWSQATVERVVERAASRDLVVVRDELLVLTASGRSLARTTFRAAG